MDQGGQEAMEFGVLAGYPMVDVKFTLEDGAYHDVDSELAFKLAGNQAFKEAARMAKPVLLEPMFAVEVTTPENFLGDVIGDINPPWTGAVDVRAPGDRVVEALVPLSEMFGYVGDLRSRPRARRRTRWSSTRTPRFPRTSPTRSSRRSAANKHRPATQTTSQETS